MEYALLIYADESVFASRSSDEKERAFASYRAYTAALREAGVYVGSVKLVESPSATSVRVRDGTTLMTDGPFAETKERLAGLYIVECADLDEALARAAELPGAKLGTVEVRPIEFRGS